MRGIKYANVKGKISVVLIIMLLLNILPIAEIGSSALLVIDNSDDAGVADVTVTNISYGVVHDGFNKSSGYIEIVGTELQAQTVLFRTTNGFESMGAIDVQNEYFIKYVLSADEATSFTGEIMIGPKVIDLDTSSFPTLRGSDKQDINIDIYDTDDSNEDNFLNLVGENLDQISSDSEVEAKFGIGTMTTSIPSGNDLITSSLITLDRPTPPDSEGFQDITITKEHVDSANEIRTSVQYVYEDAFRFIKNVGIEELQMYPNTGAQGDEVILTGTNFSDTKDYKVYFIKSLTGADNYLDINEAEHVSLFLDVDDTKDVLTVKVPEDPDFELGSYYVMLTDTLNGEVIAEQLVRVDPEDSGSDPSEYVVIESSYVPTIETIYPEIGPDTGGEVEISGRNIISLNLPDLVSDNEIKDTSPLRNPDLSADSETLLIEYEDGLYKGISATITRTVTVQIGKPAEFSLDSDDEVQVTVGIPDKIVVNTAIIDDALIDPLKDVIIEIETTINNGTEYVFNQMVTLEDGFEFEPSTYNPTIEEVLPETIQVEDEMLGSDIYKGFVNEVLLAIKGQDLFIVREITDEGDVVTKKPTVLIKQDNSNTNTDNYQIGFFPNEEYLYDGDGDGIADDKVVGVIRYKDGVDTSDSHVLFASDGVTPYELDMKVIGEDGEELDGTSGNELGIKILISIPESMIIPNLGIQSVQVTNPRKDISEYGQSTLLSESLTFIETSDIPVIESVEPGIVTVEGGDEIVIEGSNFQEGIKMYLDGEEITEFSREIDITGNKMVITFTAPEGREGETQIFLLNPSGGSDVSQFLYVDSFDQDPIIDTFTPAIGTAETLVVINGDNYLRPDPTVTDISGLDALRLVGTRVYLDGEDVSYYNEDIYGNIEFVDYSVPASNSLITASYGKATYSEFYKNTTVTNDSTGSTVELINDAYNNPMLVSDNGSYAIRYNGSDFEAYDEDDELVGSVSMEFDNGDTSKISISNGVSFTAVMNNNIAIVTKNYDGEYTVALADYAEGVILENSYGEHYSIYTDYDRMPILTNAKDESYSLVYSDGNIIARDDVGNEKTIIPNSTGLTINGIQLDMITAYRINSETGELDGKNIDIVSKEQITFTVPYLDTGKGYKDLKVVNPDTKSDEKIEEEGFYYVAQSTSDPVISTIDPEKGSVYGGYFVVISGSDFENDVKVYIDSVEVPSEDTYVSLDGLTLKIKMPASTKDLAGDFGIDELDVSVVVLNPDGGTAFKEEGFTYIIPNSEPVIEELIPEYGSSNGSEIVEIIGYEFRFYEPYENLVGTSNYEIGDSFDDIYPNSTWDDLFDSSLDPNAISKVPDNTSIYYDYYYESLILPTVYFGEEKAKIVEYSNGYLKVLTPSHEAGSVEVYVINNDSGVSNKVSYEYNSSSPSISEINPSEGSRQGLEPKDIYGIDLYSSSIYGYTGDDNTSITKLEDVEALVKFGDIDNVDLERNEVNSGLINSERANVNLEGELTVSYYGDSDEIKIGLLEGNVYYERVFEGYIDEEVFFPLDMLKDDSDYYVPFGREDVDSTSYSGNVYEYIRVWVEDRRVLVERGYAPQVTYDNATHVEVLTPSYYSIGVVPVTYFNPDGGSASSQFEYANPSSQPMIYSIEPSEVDYEETSLNIEASMSGGMDIEILGTDFRENIQVQIGIYDATVKELITETRDGVEYDVLVVNVPQGTEDDIDIKYPIILINEDSGIANSTYIPNLIGPNYDIGETDQTLPFNFVYKKSLSEPEIDSVDPVETSVYGGNLVTIYGSDFRSGAYVVIGTTAGVPITDIDINTEGTIIQFYTPENLGNGIKDVQVINSDYGIGILESGIAIVSYPTVESDIVDEDGRRVEYISVEGGDTIVLTGTDFQEGSSVYFGGQWLKVEDNPGATGTEGLYKDDEYYIITDEAVASPTVEYVDEYTLIVTTPAVTYEGEVPIVVINEDGGISSPTTLDYVLPIPDAPYGLEVELIDDRYIKLHNYVAESAEYFEIYVYIGSKSTSELGGNNMKDFKYIGVTDTEPYKITYLPGAEDLSEDEYIYFVIKAANMYGTSQWSNVVHLSYTDMEEVEELGPPNLDGDIGVDPKKNYEIDLDGENLTIDAGQVDLDSTIYIDLDEYEYRNGSNRVINVPEDTIDNFRMTTFVMNFGDSIMQFRPMALDTDEFRNIAYYDKAYGVINADIGDDSYTSMLRNKIPRGKKAVSDLYQIDYFAFSNSKSTEFDILADPIDIQIYYTEGLSDAQKAQVNLYKYDDDSRAWTIVEAVVDTDTNSVVARIYEAGDYIVLTSR